MHHIRDTNGGRSQPMTSRQHRKIMDKGRWNTETPSTHIPCNNSPLEKNPTVEMGPVFHGAMGCNQRNCNLVCRYYQLLSEFLAKVYLPRVSCQSRLSANVKGDNEMIPWHLPCSVGKPLKFLDRRQSMKVMRLVIASNGVHCHRWG